LFISFIKDSREMSSGLNPVIAEYNLDMQADATKIGVATIETTVEAAINMFDRWIN
jgi:hypothetical protein